MKLCKRRFLNRRTIKTWLNTYIYKRKIDELISNGKFKRDKKHKYILRNMEKIKIGKRLKWINRIRIGKGKGKKLGKLQFCIKILFQELLNIYVILSNLRNIYVYSIFIN